MDKRKATVEKACYFWELGLLHFLFEKGVISEEEYTGILKIAEEQNDKTLLCLK